MTIVIRVIAVVLAAGLLVVGLSSVSAQGGTAQLIVTTRIGNGSSMPSATPAVTVIGSGPSLTGVPSSSGTLTYAGNFNNESKVITMIPSNYSVSASSISGYVYTYSSACSGTLYSGEVKTCTITASQAGSARINVFTTVVNNDGGSRIPSDFTIQVSGGGAFPSSFQGSSAGVSVTLNPGSYSIDEVTNYGYTKTRSDGCSGSIAAGEVKTCIIGNDDVSYMTPGTLSTLVCTPQRQAVRSGDAVTFTAAGGSGSYNWATSDRTYLNAGSRISVILQTVGTQTVIVTSGYQTAVCTVDVYSSGTPAYQVIPGGQVQGASTVAPGLPNTGFGPNPLGLALTLIGGITMAGGLLFYGRKALVYIWQ